VVVTLSLAAIIGDSTGYISGRRLAQHCIIARNRGFQSRAFAGHQGVLRQIRRDHYYPGPFHAVRQTFAPVVAGVAEMNYRKFLTFNVVEGSAG